MDYSSSANVRWATFLFRIDHTSYAPGTAASQVDTANGVARAAGSLRLRFAGLTGAVESTEAGVIANAGFGLYVMFVGSDDGLHPLTLTRNATTYTSTGGPYLPAVFGQWFDANKPFTGAAVTTGDGCLDLGFAVAASVDRGGPPPHVRRGPLVGRRAGARRTGAHVRHLVPLGRTGRIVLRNVRRTLRHVVQMSKSAMRICT